MTQEDRKLLLIDLCARLPYGIKVKYAIPTLLVSIRNDKDGIKVITEGYYGEHVFNIKDIKPYLRPMTSMTADEAGVYISLKEDIIASDGLTYFFETYESIDWLNAHHFDYRGLIEKGLALEAPEGMYNNYLI